MARDYDYLFKLLIIGDSGKETSGFAFRDGPRWVSLASRIANKLVVKNRGLGILHFPSQSQGLCAWILCV